MRDVQAFENEDEGGYLWECPHCQALNDVGDDFMWQNGRYETRDGYTCEHCESDEEFKLFRR